MANTKKTTTKKVEETKLENKEEVKVKEKQNTTVKMRKDIPLNTMVACRNACKNRLVYISRRQMGYEVTWENFGSTEWLELSELISLKNSYPRFFKDGWLIIEDPEIIEYLGIEKYYENIINIDDFESIFSVDPKELEEKLTELPSGFRDTVIEKARELIAEKKLDSMSRIEVIEKVFNVDLRI
jgi:hypothetical protein